MEPAIKPLKLAIIGAGVSGLSAAWSLQPCKNINITIFEKSKGFSGRAATRRRDAFTYDYGANYFYTDKAELIDFVKNKLPTTDLVEIEKPLYTFDSAGKLSPPDSKHGKETKWTYKNGISNIGKLIYALCDKNTELKKSTRVERLISTKNHENPDSNLWKLISPEKEDLGTFDAVLLTPPAPQIVDLLKLSDFQAEHKSIQSGLVEALEVAEYKTQYTIVLAYSKRVTQDLKYFALINTDKEHDIAWISIEDQKAGHVPDDKSLIVVQMAPSWSEEAVAKGRSTEDMVSEVRAKLEELIGIKDHVTKDDLLFSDTQKWRYALPNKAADKNKLSEGPKCGLFFGGDYLVGKGRVLDALETGLRAGDEIRSSYSKSDAKL